MAARRERGLFDPDAAAGREPVRPPRSTCIASDGDIEEGITSEASSLAGTQQLGNLDAALRRQPHLDRGRHRRSRSPRTSRRATRPTAGTSSTSTGSATTAATTRTSALWRPRSTRPGGHRPAVVHRAAHDHRAGRRPTRRTPARRTAPRSAPTRSPRPRRSSGFDPDRDLRRRRRGARARPRGRRPRPRRARRVAATASTPGRPRTPSGTALLDRLSDRARCPTAGPTALPEFPADAKGMATRKASGNVLTAIAPVLPELWGGSADLAESQQHDARGRAVLPARGPPVQGRSPAARTAACCTSASASTRWARS